MPRWHWSIKTKPYWSRSYAGTSKRTSWRETNNWRSKRGKPAWPKSTPVPSARAHSQAWKRCKRRVRWPTTSRASPPISPARATPSPPARRRPSKPGSQEQSAAALTQAASQLQQAESAQRDAAPLLNQAKALDARIEAMLPAHRSAAASYESSARADAQAQAALQVKQEQRRQLETAQQSGMDWLAQHEQWRTMAQSWDRWDVLFVQAGQAASQAEKLARALASVRHRAEGHRADEADASAKLAASAATLQTLEAQRQAATNAWSAFSPDALQNQRRQLEQRRDLLASAEKLWIDLDARQ